MYDDYDYRVSFERRAHLHYEGDPRDDAAWILGEVVRKGRSRGWVEEPSEREISAEIERILARFNVGYIGKGVWSHVTGGSRFFSHHPNIDRGEQL